MSLRDSMAEKIARRKAIREKIRVLSKKVSVARDIIAGLNDCKRDIQRNTESWNNTYDGFKAVPIQAEVIVPDVFEGVVAEALSAEIPATAALMNQTCGEMAALCGIISIQIQKLQEYIEKLQAQIQLLYIELAAI